jgi:phenylacetate-coenzyme A ligase PaaK-like adenylate-forming protein
MPFLRYRLGDLVTMGPTPCPCGMVCRTIASIRGRVMDRISLRGGGFLHPFAIIRPFASDFRWVRRFQFRQVSADAMVLQVVAGRPPAPEEIEAMRRAIDEKLGHSYLVDVQIVERITPSPTGKHYPFVSRERLEAWGQGRDLE